MLKREVDTKTVRQSVRDRDIHTGIPLITFKFAVRWGRCEVYFSRNSNNRRVSLTSKV